MKKLLKWLVLIFSWFTVSPLMLYLGKKWQIGKKKARVALMLLSPLFLILYAFLLSAFLYCGDIVYRMQYFRNRDRIERITGVALPAFRITNCKIGSRGFNGDYKDSFTFKFKSLPSDELFDDIDKMIETGETEWKKEGNKYSFFQMWGNGMPAPKGEKDDDNSFGITITRGEKQGRVTHGRW